MNCRVIALLSAFVVALAATPAARRQTAPVTDDVFGYSFLHAMNLNGGGFGGVLANGVTSTGHDTKSVLKFDLSGISLTSAQVTSATLDLYVIDTTLTGFGVSASPSEPITINLSALGPGAWDEATATWDTFPASAGQYDSLVIDGYNQTVSFDVTALVKDWLDGSLANNGLLLEADAAVGGSPNWVYAVFSSHEGQVAPVLNIVPEPTSAALAVGALGTLMWFGRRRLQTGKRLSRNQRQ